MKYIVTKVELQGQYLKIDLLKTWKKAATNSLVEVCDHENIEKFDCSCNYGCDLCSKSQRCLDCGCLFNNDKIKSVKLLK